MKLTLQALYNLVKEKDIPVLGHDGLPFHNQTTVATSEGEVFFRHDPEYKSEDRDYLDFVDFYEICIPSICRNDVIAGNCEFHTEDGITWMGVDLFNKDLELLTFVDR